MKTEKIKKEDEIAVASSGTGIEIPDNEDLNTGDAGDGSTDESNDGTSNDDESGRPNRGTGSAGVKRPGGTGGKGQYSLRNSDEE